MGFVFSRINPTDAFGLPKKYIGLLPSVHRGWYGWRERPVAQLEECIDLLSELVQESAQRRSAGDPEGIDHGLLDENLGMGGSLIQCQIDRLTDELGPLQMRLSCGAEVDEIGALSAIVLRQCELTAKAIDTRNAVRVSILMLDIHDLLLELNSRQLWDANVASIRAHNARTAADARHAEHRAMRAQVLEHYKANKQKHKSKDAAAEAIAGKLVPMPFRTVRDWLKNA